MNITKFVWLLRNNALWFARADKLGDPFEGSRPELDTKILVRTEQQKNAGEFAEKTLVEMKELDIPKQALDNLCQARKERTKSTFINCWHMNDFESAGMWSLYGNRNNDGSVCIQSTLQKLYDVLDASDNKLYIGQVEYIDYTQTSYKNDIRYDTNEYRFFVLKRKSYEHEKELRAVIMDSSKCGTNITHISVPVSVKELIDTVYISPNASEEFCYAIQCILDKSGLNLKLTKSDLDTSPLY